MRRLAVEDIGAGNLLVVVLLPTHGRPFNPPANNTLEHLSNGLAAGSIKSFEKKVGEIKKISQPIASFGGVPKETQTEYYRRVSERLRHKNKAITQWDYEHLILDQFPEIYKTKCLNHTSKESSFAPGEVLIIVIPNSYNFV